MPALSSILDLKRCPHCGVDTPNLTQCHDSDLLESEIPFITTKNHLGSDQRVWGIYTCKRCGGLVTAYAESEQAQVQHWYPDTQDVDEAIPSPAREYLQQAQDTIHAPAGSVLLSASAVDAMLKVKGYKEGSLNSRINKAAGDHLITQDMATWAHQVRLDANSQRHVDEGIPLPTKEDAERSADFATALAEFLFVLPSRVRRGLDETKGKA